MDFVAELGNPAFQPMGDWIFPALSERRATAFLLRFTCLEHRIGCWATHCGAVQHFNRRAL